MSTLIVAYGIAGLSTILYALWLYLGDVRLLQRQRDSETQCHPRSREAPRKSAA